MCRRRSSESGNVKEAVCWLRLSADIEKLFLESPPPHTVFTVMSEDTLQNCLIYACNVSCLFRCRSVSTEPPTVAAESGGEFAGRLPGKHQHSLIM